VFILQTKSL